MKPRRWTSLLILGLVILVQAIFLWEMRRQEPEAFVSAPPAAATVRVQVVALTGEVLIVSSLGERRAVRGDELLPGESLATLADGRATLRLDRYGDAVLNPSSRIRSRAGRPEEGVVLSLESGSAYVSLEARGRTDVPDTPLVTIHTPSLTCLPANSEPAEYFLSVEPEP